MKMNLTDFLIVFAGSGLGGVCRYGLSHAVALNTGGVIFPWGTFAVNMLGCLLIGVIYGLADRWSVLNPELRLLLAVGVCGGVRRQPFRRIRLCMAWQYDRALNEGCAFQTSAT